MRTGTKAKASRRSRTAPVTLLGLTFPAWVSWIGLIEHVGVGLAETIVLHLLHTPPLATVVAVLATAIAKEYGEEPSDFDPAYGGPLNGILDILAFMPAPFVAWWLWK